MREAGRSTRVGIWRTVTAGEITNAWAVENGWREDATRTVSNWKNDGDDCGGSPHLLAPDLECAYGGANRVTTRFWR